MSHDFALLGVAGFVAPRHLEAIAKTGNRLVAACDPFDSVGVMDRYFPEASFFTEFERFDRFLEKQRRGDRRPVEYVSICSPNYLHDAHVRLALRVGATAICEKPLVINPWNLDQLASIEEETGSRVQTVLQLRLAPTVQALKARIEAAPPGEKFDVELTYMSRRGRWYHVSWKGQEEKSGGLATNIGIHLFDLMLWLFGGVERSEVHAYDADRVAGVLELKRANVRWYLSTRAEDLPAEVRAKGGHAHRSIRLDGEEVEFSSGFTGLHTRVYEEIIAGRGYGIEDARPAIELAHRIRTSAPVDPTELVHPMLAYRASKPPRP